MIAAPWVHASVRLPPLERGWDPDWLGASATHKRDETSSPQQGTEARGPAAQSRRMLPAARRPWAAAL